jgi:predicted O-methyltransferase YrrM
MIKTIFNKLGLYRLAFPPGHFASPIPNVTEIFDSKKLFDESQDIKDIELNIEKQIENIEALKEYIIDNPYEKPNLINRYKFENGMLGPMDGLVLFSVIRKYNPSRIVEVGSGYSSAIMLDVNNLYFGDKLKLTFIEPYPARLNSLLRDNDAQSVQIIEDKIQNVDLELFKNLEENDILFLDTSHIVKTGSDVNYWLFNILPILKTGVIIHIHDIFWPMEYPKEWIEQQKCYTEIYLIRAFLMNNSDYEIIVFNNFLQKKYNNHIIKISEKLTETQGGSLWLRKVR